MDPATKARLLEEGGKIVGSFLRVVVSRPRKSSTGTKEELTESSQPTALPQPSGVSLPTAEETLQELKERLYEEIYTAERDLSVGLLIAGKPCRCLEYKHRLKIQALAKELIPEDPNNIVYSDIIQWLTDNQDKVNTQAIASGKYKQEYPHMAAQFKEFRKRLERTMAPSTTKSASPVPSFDDAWKVVEQQAKKDAEQLVVTQVPTSPFTLEDAKKLAAEEAAKEVERVWKGRVRDGTK